MFLRYYMQSDISNHKIMFYERVTFVFNDFMVMNHYYTSYYVVKDMDLLQTAICMQYIFG